jgi:FAD/FMN-containing dehydrogenase
VPASRTGLLRPEKIACKAEPLFVSRGARPSSLPVKKWIVGGVVLLLAATVGPPAVFLASVWWQDGARPHPVVATGTDDASRMNANTPAAVIAIADDPAAAERQLADLVKRAASEGTRISISGTHHSMGGHTMYPGGVVLDMLPFNRMSLDETTHLLTVGSGARWADIIPFLDLRGYAVSIMQTNNDFSVGGSLSVNCHGWQNDAPPISSTVQSFRILTADGKVRRCSRTENQELFSLALGGYGLFGVILEVELQVVSNEFYIAEPHRVSPADYSRTYHQLTHNRTDVGMAYGRINVAPNSFLEHGLVTLLKRDATNQPTHGTLSGEESSLLKRLVFRGGIGSDYGKNLRWWLENTMGETGGKVLSRNQIMHEPSNLYAGRDGNSTDILHEYFVPPTRLGEFVDRIRPILLKFRPELLNITLRNVETDNDTFMRYATEEVFGLVLLFHQTRDAAADARMRALTRELIDAAIACGGRYYLPYRPHATLDQFVRSYPQAPQFFALKQRYDPAGIFVNQFYLNYGQPLLEAQSTMPASSEAVATR